MKASLGYELVKSEGNESPNETKFSFCNSVNSRILATDSLLSSSEILIAQFPSERHLAFGDRFPGLDLFQRATQNDLIGCRLRLVEIRSG